MSYLWIFVISVSDSSIDSYSNVVRILPRVTQDPKLALSMTILFFFLFFLEATFIESFFEQVQKGSFSYFSYGIILYMLVDFVQVE